MIGFIVKGILRDRSRSLFPFLIICAGVMLTVFFFSWMKGAKTNFMDSSARYSTGHLKVMTRAYAEEADLLPNDLALVGVSELLGKLREEYPELIWNPRIRFAGLLDVPDENGDTRAQGPITGLAVGLFPAEETASKSSKTYSEGELTTLNLKKGLLSGQLPENPQEILVGSELAISLNLHPGDRATIISSTMTGAMAVADFRVAGIIKFGITPLDRGMLVANLSDIRRFLDMEDAAGEILGLFKDYVYKDRMASEIASEFNKTFEELSNKQPDLNGGQGAEPGDHDFLPVMLTLSEQGGLSEMLAIYDFYSAILVAVFVAVMSIVLWNAGLMGSLRRYGEIGVRLAMGEEKRHLYFSLIGESLIIGCLGSAVGTALGLAVSYYLQIHGLNIETFTKSSSMMLGNVLRAQVTPLSYAIGFIPGMLATFLGTAIAGIAVFRRKTSTLMKEFEA